MIEERGVENARIVEVGCGKGYFLRRLVEQGRGNMGWGFDPSYVGADSDLDGRLTFERKYYGPGCESLRADVVVCRHVIEHVADPLALLATVRAALATSPGARVFFETPALSWILEHVVLWDFFYEHCSLFSAQSLTTAFERAGFSVTRVTKTFGEQYLWLEATLAHPTDTPSCDASSIPALARRFGERERQWIEAWRDRLRSGGKLAIWGAGAKGVTFANLVDPDCELIDSVIDLNPHKQGHFVPGTGHPIVAPAALGERGVTRAILMNPNYRAENLALLHSLQLDIELEEQTV
jgi:SAM-dependent methyltransferase